MNLFVLLHEFHYIFSFVILIFLFSVSVSKFSTVSSICFLYVLKHESHHFWTILILVLICFVFHFVIYIFTCIWKKRSVSPKMYLQMWFYIFRDCTVVFFVLEANVSDFCELCVFQNKSLSLCDFYFNLIFTVYNLWSAVLFYFWQLLWVFMMLILLFMCLVPN